LWANVQAGIEVLAVNVKKNRECERRCRNSVPDWPLATAMKLSYI
jgi:hypothetical protein